MKLERVIEILEKHQEWRRDENVPAKTEMQSPIEIGTAIDYALIELKKLRLGFVVKSLPIQDLPNCTRVEVIDQKGRSYVNWKPSNKVRLSMQDEGRTVKIFID